MTIRSWELEGQCSLVVCVLRCIVNLKTQSLPESCSLLFWGFLIENAVFVTIAKLFHYTKITAAAASVQYIYCKLEILSMNLMLLISRHSSCSYQLCPYALMCLLDYV